MVYTTLIDNIDQDIKILNSGAANGGQSVAANLTAQFNGLKKYLFNEVNATLTKIKASLPDKRAFQEQQTFNLYQ